MEISNIQMTDLPNEIKENILSNLDGISLIRMRSVSKEWKKLLDKPSIKLLKKWKEVCKSEIDDDSLICVLSQLHPKYYICNKLEYWKVVYKCWRQWSKMPDWNFTQCEVHNLKNCEITCIINSGEWLIVGTRNYGSILAFHYPTRYNEVLYEGGNVINVRLHSVSKEPPLLKGLGHDKLTVWFENLLRAELDFHTLKVDIFEELSGKPQIHNFENKEVKIEINGNKSTMSLLKKSENILRTLDLLDYWSVEHCWPNGNLLYCKKGDYLVIDDDLIESHDHPFTKLPRLHLGEKTICYNFGRSIIISVNTRQYANHEMIVRVLNKEQKYNPFIDLSYHITSVIYHGMMLFIGTDIGNIYVYQTQSIFDLLHMDLCVPCTVLECGNDPIISITLRETNNKPIIWAANSYKIFNITFV